MQRTGNQIIAVLQSNRMPWLPTANGIEYLNRVYGDIIAFLPDSLRLAMASPQSVAFTVGDQEKSIAVPMNQIDHAVWDPASGSNKKLVPIRIDSLNRGQSTPADGLWRGITNASPSSFYIITDSTGQRIGLQAPTDAAGDVKLYGSVLPSTLDGTELLTPLFNDGVFMEGISFFAALDRGKQSTSIYYDIYQLELVKAAKWFETISEGFQDNEKNVRSIR